MNWPYFIPTLLLVVLGAPGADDAALQANRDEPFPITLCLVPEMARIPEVDDWDFCAPDEFPEHSVAAGKAWADSLPWAARHVTPRLARELSRWARPQMEQYTEVPPLDEAPLELVRRRPRGGKLVYEITADTLPSHAPLVTRWLKVYLVYDMDGKSIVRMTVTIRGQRLE